MAWFQKKPRIASVDNEADIKPASRMEGLWVKCDSCGEILYRADLEKQLNVCPTCTHHMPLPARARIASVLDADSFQEHDQSLEPMDWGPSLSTDGAQLCKAKPQLSEQAFHHLRRWR